MLNPSLIDRFVSLYSVGLVKKDLRKYMEVTIIENQTKANTFQKERLAGRKARIKNDRSSCV